MYHTLNTTHAGAGGRRGRRAKTYSDRAIRRSIMIMIIMILMIIVNTYIYIYIYICIIVIIIMIIIMITVMHNMIPISRSNNHISLLQNLNNSHRVVEALEVNL